MDDLDRLARDFDDAGDELGARVFAVVRVATLKAEGLAKANAPVRTGALVNSIDHSFDGGPGSDVISGETGSALSYARFVEGGTSRMEPQPFMLPAGQAVEPEFHAALAALGGDVLGTVRHKRARTRRRRG